MQDHVPWLHLSKRIIEVRPLRPPWKQSPTNWSIDLRQSRITKGNECLVDMHSAAWDMVSRRFRCLDNPENLVITVPAVDPTQSSSPSPQLSVTLPRYGLSFFVNEANELESRDFKNMVYDERQSIGTLFGLVNRFVLRPRAQIPEDVIPKRVLVPRDLFHENPYGLDAQPFLSESDGYYTYQVDPELGCLKGIVDLESRCYLACLHASTGRGCRADPLTGRTGVEEAISLMWSAGTRETFDDRESPKWVDPQIGLALARICCLTKEKDRPSDGALLQAAYLFPSEAAASVQFCKKRSTTSLDQLFRDPKRPVPTLPARKKLHLCNPGRRALPSHDSDPLRQLLSSLQTNKSVPPFQNEYIKDLQCSTDRFMELDHVCDTCRSHGSEPDKAVLRDHYTQCKAKYNEGLEGIKKALGPETEMEKIFYQCGQWPRVTPFTLFRCLASTSPIKPPENWQKCLISLALLALDVQRARRMLLFFEGKSDEELYKELENEGCDEEDHVKHPDWLLVQVCPFRLQRSPTLMSLPQLQGDFLIRRLQAEIAKEVISSEENTVTQVNMGEGKTSVIIPICAAALADGNRLVRVIVPKALIPQTLQVLTNRLCGLVDKPIYHLTFSRGDIKHIDKVRRLLTLAQECRKNGGVLVMQPEHVLSLKLATVETQFMEDGNRAYSMSTRQGQAFEHALQFLAESLTSVSTVITTTMVLR